MKPRDAQPYDADVLAIMKTGPGWGTYFQAYALAYVDWRMGNRARRPAKRAYGCTGAAATRLDKHLDNNI
jgi:hypothetical protein